jgi:Dna[CI] antecedent, DciA
MIRRKRAITLLQATKDSEVLNQLFELASESSQRLKSIQPLLPPTLRAAVHPGPIEGPVWCLLLDSNAVAAKLKQLLPSLQAHLRSKGWEVNAIRLKVQTPNVASR